jgi:hypothetical protein
MGFLRSPITWLGLVAGICAGGLAVAQPPASEPSQAEPPQQDRTHVPWRIGVARPPTLSHEIPWLMMERVPVRQRDSLRRVLQQPTLVTHGPEEVFHGHPGLYFWLLDHPDQAVHMWRRLGARCMDITDRGNGRFGWNDGQGTEVHWDTVYRDNSLRVWLAEGSSRPTLLLPAVPVRAVVVLHHQESRDSLGSPLIHHQADLFVQTDSRTAALVARLLGASGPRLAEQCVAQLEMFFSALVWYLDRHPDRLNTLLGAKTPTHE